MWSAFTLFFLLYGHLFCAIEQSRIRLNGGSYRWSGFGCEKWTNVREFQDYSSLASLVFRNESLADHLHGHLHADCDLLYWLPWNSNNGFLERFIALLGSPNTRRGSLKIKFRRHKRPCAYYANSNATFHLILDVGDLVFKLNQALIIGSQQLFLQIEWSRMVTCGVDILFQRELICIIFVLWIASVLLLNFRSTGNSPRAL